MSTLSSLNLLFFNNVFEDFTMFLGYFIKYSCDAFFLPSPSQYMYLLPVNQSPRGFMEKQNGGCHESKSRKTDYQVTLNEP